jgi:rhodanese-related sulfurtransferase
VLDVRPEEEYRAGHIPGARSVPIERLEACLGEIPRTRRSSRTAAVPTACSPTRR